jgi:energy-coupling factor transporter ATP-binding protein EcfA2
MATRLRRLKIEHFRDVRPGTELRFGDGWNVLVGRNGSGKTTLLNLISMVLRDDLTALQGEAFAIQYELGVESGATCLVRVENSPTPWSSGAARADLTPSMKITLSDAERPRIFETLLLREARPDPAEMGGIEKMVVSQPLRAAREVALFRSGGDTPLDEAAKALLLTDLYECFRMDEGVAMFDVLTGANGQPGAALPPRAEVVSAFISEPVGKRGFWPRFVPRSALGKIAEISSVTRASIEFDLGDEEVLGLCVRLLGRGRVSVVATSTTADDGTSRGPSFGNFHFYSQSGVALMVPHEHWSFGQRRLLTFFWYLACNPDVIVADELVNGLHWDWIDACVDAIGTRQVFVSAQNPLLLDHLGFDSEEAVARGFVLCRTAPVGEGRSETVWTHPDAAQSAEFFRSYQNGVMQVHDILRTQGLW